MSQPDLPTGDHRDEDEAEEEHPLKAGIDAAKEGDTASLHDLLAEEE